jgi:hypothetical protein
VLELLKKHLEICSRSRAEAGNVIDARHSLSANVIRRRQSIDAHGSRVRRHKRFLVWNRALVGIVLLDWLRHDRLPDGRYLRIALASRIAVASA